MLLILMMLSLSPSDQVLPATLNPIPNCVDQSFAQVMEQSKVVFSGRVVQVDHQDETQVVRFVVIKAWKGITTSEVTITHKIKLEGLQDFQKGKSYLVFAVDSEGKLSVGGCTWSVKLSSKYAAERISALDRWKANQRSN